MPSPDSRQKWRHSRNQQLNKFGVFVADAAQTVNVTASNLVKINSDETAVDSYALSANGNKAGYVTMIAGDGQAFTPKAEPVQMHVIKVGDSLYRGEVKVILSDNPLAEKVTFMHTGDLAGSTDKFDYDWRIAAPEDGLPPAVSERNKINWCHGHDLHDRVETSAADPNCGNSRYE